MLKSFVEAQTWVNLQFLSQVREPYSIQDRTNRRTLWADNHAQLRDLLRSIVSDSDCFFTILLRIPTNTRTDSI